MVYLVDENGTVIKYRSYNSRQSRNEAIKKWQKLVGPAYYNLFIQIRPDVEDFADVQIKRHKGVYSNKTPFNIESEHT